MLDLSHIPNNQENIKVFYSTGITNAWQTWQKPRKCQYVWIMCIGGAGGGGGGSGVQFVQSTGGGSGAVTRALFNASHLPDTLYVQVGIGGAGGANLTNGSTGNKSNVSILPNTTTTNIVLASGNTAAVGGQSGTGIAAAGETASTTANATFLTLSNFISTAGRPSSAFDGIDDWLPTNPLTSQITCPGAGGSVTGGGGSIQATSISPSIPGGAIGAIGGNGQNGITSWKPFYSLGGSGGGPATSGKGGNGGNGGIGSGGGGGGSATDGEPGKGGDGGDGLVVIISF